ncbi:hypothetical protein EL22_27370 [Halostagnicola sp. A56]|nr:hypothetical protein EL22_27370 [Halostagnicola sp. A56]
MARESVRFDQCCGSLLRFLLKTLACAHRWGASLEDVRFHNTIETPTGRREFRFYMIYILYKKKELNL